MATQVIGLRVKDTIAAIAVARHTSFIMVVFFTILTKDKNVFNNSRYCNYFVLNCYPNLDLPIFKHQTV